MAKSTLEMLARHRQAEVVSSRVAAVPIAVPVGAILPSRTNTRSGSEKQLASKVADLAESIRAHGILQPLLVRPGPAGHPEQGPTYELVCGRRRLAAARLAGVDVVPVQVRELTDRDALEVQLIENGRRADFHPLEEAESYLALVKLGVALPEVAARTGAPLSRVHARLSLARLPEKAKQQLWEGSLSLSVALLVARVHGEARQLRALELVTRTVHTYLPGGPGAVEGGLTLEAATRVIRDQFMLDLRRAPFPAADATVVPAAGPCSTCPKRAGNQPELFAEAKSGDLCTDPDCFAGKARAWRLLEESAARARGHKVLSAEAGRRIFSRAAYSSETAPVSPHAGYVAADAELRVGRQEVPVRQLLKAAGAEPEICVARHPETGKLRQVLRVATLAQQLAALPKAKRPDLAPFRESAGHAQKRPAGPSPAEQRLQAATDELLVARVRARAAELDLLAFVRCWVAAQAWQFREPLRKMGTRIRSDSAVAAWAARAKPAELRRALLEQLLEDGADGQLASAFGLDPKQLRSEAAVKLAAEDKGGAK